MGFFDELKKITRPYDDEDDEFIDESDGMEPPAAPERRANPFSGFGAEPPSSQPRQNARQGRQSKEGRVVSINGGAGMQPSKLVLVKPERFDAAAEIADHLRDGHSIIMNLETTPKDISRRLIDFLSGVTYALDGKIQKAAASTYVIAPRNADLSGDLAEDLESGSAYL